MPYAKSQQPTATDVVMTDAPGFVKAAANSSVFKNNAMDLIGRMLGRATVDGSFLQTAATKIINAAPPVLPPGNGFQLACMLTGFFLGAGALQTAQYLRQRRRPAPVDAEQRIARRWGFLWRKEVETDVALRAMADNQAVQLLELDIQYSLNAQSVDDAQAAHDVSDTTDEIPPPLDIQTILPITQRYARDITAEGIPSQGMYSMIRR